MTERELPLSTDKDPTPPPVVTMIDILVANAQSSIFPEIREILRQRAEQSGEGKVNVDVPGFAHVDHAVDQLGRFDDPNINELRVPSSLLQTTTEPQPDFEGGYPTRGPLPVDHEEVQLRLDHIYALLGSARQSPPRDTDLPVVELISKTNLGPNIYAIEERSAASVAVRIIRTDKNPALHRRIQRNPRR